MKIKYQREIVTLETLQQFHDLTAKELQVKIDGAKNNKLKIDNLVYDIVITPPKPRNTESSVLVVSNVVLSKNNVAGRRAYVYFLDGKRTSIGDIAKLFNKSPYTVRMKIANIRKCKLNDILYERKEIKGAMRIKHVDSKESITMSVQEAVEFMKMTAGSLYNYAEKKWYTKEGYRIYTNKNPE